MVMLMADVWLLMLDEDEADDVVADADHDHDDGNDGNEDRV